MAIRSATVLLSQAVERLESGDVVSAGCHAREALRRHLRELCDRYDCRPRGDQSIRAYVKALAAIGVVGPSRKRALKRLDSVCCAASRLLIVRPNKMRKTIGLVRVAVVQPMAIEIGGAI
jgi:hypothetical protein